MALAVKSPAPAVKSLALAVESPAPAVKSPAPAVKSPAPAVQSPALRSHYSTILVPTTTRIQFLATATSIKNYHNLVLVTSHTIAEGIVYYTSRGEIE